MGVVTVMLENIFFLKCVGLGWLLRGSFLVDLIWASQSIAQVFRPQMHGVGRGRWGLSSPALWEVAR